MADTSRSASGMESPSTAATVILCTELAIPRLNRLRCAVAKGTKAVSSWSCPHGVCPLAASTPITSTGALRTRITFPTALSSPNRFFATVAPITTTLAPDRASSSKKKRPSSILHSLIEKMSSVLPVTMVDQFMLPYTSCTRPNTSGATPAKVHASSRSASASSVVRVAPEPACCLTPPTEGAPGMIMRMLAPTPEMNC